MNLVENLDRAPDSKAANAKPYLVLLSGSDQAELLARLAGLQQSLGGEQDLAALARRYYADFRADDLQLALVAHSLPELAEEAEKARSGLLKAFADQREWKTPLGSYFTPAPLGKTGQVVFVYPGAFNSYLGMEQGLFEEFPGLFEKFARRSFAPESVLNQSLAGHTTAEQLAALNAQLEADATNMILSGTSFSVLLTLILQDYFKLQPKRAFGYSLGETSMLWSLGVWTAYEVAAQAFKVSPLFSRRLTGPKESVREQWQLPATSQDFWQTYFLMTSVEKVKQAIADEKHVYITHINTPEEVVISGATEACWRVLDRLNCHHLQRPHSFVLHCEPARAEEAEFYKIYSFPVQAHPEVTFYSAATYEPLSLSDGQELTRYLTKMVCEPVDFPRLVNRVYQDAGQIFIELGPGNTCSRWINKILRNKPHVAAPMNQRGTPAYLAVLRVLARLVSHQVPLDLSLLYAEAAKPAQTTTAKLPNLQPTKLNQNMVGLAQVQANFLANRRAGLAQLTQLSSLYADLLANPAAAQVAAPPAKPALFSQRQIEEFATGSVVACFGSDYAVYENKRLPRIPNGDLLFMSRITEIGGAKSDFEKVSSITAEYDVPRDPWFYRQNSYPYLPYCLYLEIALQPCGFLSAYKGSSLVFADKDLYFRNLDGRATIEREIDLRGQTVTTRARLLSTAKFEGTIIQRFEFESECGDQVFYKGESSFGFFSREVMLRQVGLDGGKEVSAWLNTPPTKKLPRLRLDLNNPATRQNYFQAKASQPFYHLASDQLDFLDEVQIVPGGGKFGQGYVFATRAINPADWFYRCHFYQDPVMPGSLGVEAIFEALQLYALQQNLAAHLKSPRFGQLPGQSLTWKYRGQITPDNRQMALEIHLNRVEISPQQVTLVANASLWKDGLRIYEINDLALAITEASA